MNPLNNPRESEETIFLQAIDQIYEINKNSSNFSDEENKEFFEDGDIKINFDFIDFSDELFITTKNEQKNSEGNLSNSSLSSDSTEFESFSASRSLSVKFLTEKKNSKIKDFLLPKHKNLVEEVQKLKENFKNSFLNAEVSAKNKIKMFENVQQNFNCNNSNNSINQFSHNYNFAIQQNMNCNNYCGLPPARNIGMNMNNINMMCNNYQIGFFQQPINKNINVKIESSLIGPNSNNRKYSYPNISSN